jgi:hypothetical protein
MAYRRDAVEIRGCFPLYQGSIIATINGIGAILPKQKSGSTRLPQSLRII